ncbi:MAG TPA: BREX system ATP-binding domain-containing protein [Myxococcota bacterium]|nr:BREX system ATP-binding domain-containing protein [Myxococcota bacterium]
MAQRVQGAGLHAFVGREQELATLLAALDAAARGAGGVQLLRGEAGIGKSRTAREVVAAARERGFTVGIGHCLDGDAAPAYEPWVRALEGSPAGEELEARCPASRRAAQGDLGDVDAERDELFRRVEASLREDAAKRPRMLLLEDLHWADVDSLRLLQHLARRLDGCAWLALCTWRDDEPVGERRERALAAVARVASAVPLGPFDENEVATLVAHWSGQRPDAALVRAARQRSGGNPLFLCELIALVLARERRVSLDALQSVGIPAVLQQLLERRLEQLSTETAERLGRAAVLGNPFALAELATWLRETPDALLASLEPAEQLRLVEPWSDTADHFRFTHALVRDAVLARLSRTERARAHREVAAMLEATGRDRSEPELARLAEHHRRGLSAHSAARAVACAAAAASLAGREGAPDQAVRHLGLALDSLAGVEAPQEDLERRRCNLLLELAEAQVRAGERRDANGAYLAAAQIARALSLPEQLARAAIGMVGHDEDPRGASDDARRWVELALEGLGDAATPLRVALLGLASRIASGRGEAQRCQGLARQALAIAERLHRSDTLANALHALHLSIDAADGLAERGALSERMVAAAESGPSRSTEFRARQTRFTDLLRCGDAVAADEELMRIEALARAYDRPVFRHHALTLAAGCDLWRGRFASAERRIAEALELGRRAGMRNAQALFAVQMFYLREQQGRLAELRPALVEMVERNPQVRSLPLTVPLAAMQEGDALLARTTFEPIASHDFEDVPRDLDWLPVIGACARVAAFLGDRPRCALLLEKLRPYAAWCIALPYGQYWDGSVALPLALLEAVLDKHDDARAHFGVALELHRRAGALPLIAHTLHAFGCFEAEAGRRDVAVPVLREALALFQRLDVALFAGRSEAALAELDARAGLAPLPPPRALGDARFAREGTRWQVVYAGRRAAIEHRKGMRDLALLLAAPGREIHALDLMTSELAGAGGRMAGAADAITGAGPSSLPGVDAAALARYRERLGDLRAERDEAEARNDLAALESADAEIAWLEQELRSAFGAERGAGEFAEKARKAVYNRIRAAIAAIADAHPELGRHLRNSVRTGVVCVYQPESLEVWQIEHDGSR